MRLASGALPVFDRDVAAGLDDAVEGGAVDHRSLMTGKAAARHGSMTMVVAVLNLRMCSWQVAVPARAVGLAVDHQPHVPQMPSRQSWSKAIGSSPSAMRRSLTTSSISRNDMSG
jgi:hypothetical protein